ncbi:hypothetical protein AURANDRAFT_67316 [Aureococcus anophagefferens]|uniref:EF-hand domain-containing protein n=1 Tax=Aureococcus anophagefferens TaxID=44056 RepID=F0YKR1_AURAN|nr:hypothetical protein AURANDRAFT_67316 [Aureococcus anophagefferens]EGB04279.1 hypothetical protein AURANDRAFT_67316 [Aureococcus anophagefferens]|eukprot:XP_009040989.1 hypothetical protein AURANDRAFT_67316 [Aureococcus anophagefferens]
MATHVWQLPWGAENAIRIGTFCSPITRVRSHGDSTGNLRLARKVAPKREFSGARKARVLRRAATTGFGSSKNPAGGILRRDCRSLRLRGAPTRFLHSGVGLVDDNKDGFVTLEKIQSFSRTNKIIADVFPYENLKRNEENEKIIDEACRDMNIDFDIFQYKPVVNLKCFKCDKGQRSKDGIILCSTCGKYIRDCIESGFAKRLNGHWSLERDRKKQKERFKEFIRTDLPRKLRVMYERGKCWKEFMVLLWKSCKDDTAFGLNALNLRSGNLVHSVGLVDDNKDGFVTLEKIQSFSRTNKIIADVFPYENLKRNEENEKIIDEACRDMNIDFDIFQYKPVLFCSECVKHFIVNEGVTKLKCFKCDKGQRSKDGIILCSTCGKYIRDCIESGFAKRLNGHWSLERDRKKQKERFKEFIRTDLPRKLRVMYERGKCWKEFMVLLWKVAF